MVMRVILMKREVFQRLIETLERSYSIPERSTISEALVCMRSDPRDQVLTQKRQQGVSWQTFNSECHYQRREKLEKTLNKHLESQVNYLHFRIFWLIFWKK